ncbi:MAG TPA: MFS transporter [Verrucomicrobiales bacterium]|nr:MFS transporter [Verrucomicrobiales bacterium]HIL71505.1 MFS transporter [Verrucomicrobiota bacterium]
MFGHPKGLKTLFFTELWERLSYYGMRAILVLFLVDAIQTGGFGMTDEKAGAVYGLYTAFVYLAALPGGWIADRLLGMRRTVFIGGCIIACGHFSMAIPMVATFYLGLFLIVIGTGLLKPNVSAMVGELYPEGGARRDAGFSIYYMGINMGALIGPLICGYFGEKINWHLGFSAAGIGMVFGLIQYRLGAANLGDAGSPPDISNEERSELMKRLCYGVLTLGIILVGGFTMHRLGWVNLTLERLAGGTGFFIVALAFLYFSYVLTFGKLNSEEKKKIGVIIILFFSSAIFWAGFEQAGSSMNLFADQLTDLNVFGREMPASWFQSINPMFIILLAPFFGAMWVNLATRQPSILVKFAMGLGLLSVGFFIMAWASVYASETNKVSPMWLISCYFFQTTGELCLSPVGLSSVTKLAPKALVGQMMGVWFMATALGNLIAGILGGQFSSFPLPKLFGAVACVALAAGILLVIIDRPVKKLTGDIK